MKVYVGQVYIRPGVKFSFSSRFQHYISNALTALLKPSAEFAQKYGHNFHLVFNVSAKVGIADNEIKGPTVFRKDKDVEYSVFLPFDVIMARPDVPRAALESLFRGIYSVLESLGIDATSLMKQQDSIIARVCSDPAMLESDQSGI